MTWLLFYSSFKQLINELHTSDMTPPCPIISGIYFYGRKLCRFVNCLDSQIGSGNSYLNNQNSVLAGHGRRWISCKCKCLPWTLRNSTTKLWIASRQPPLAFCRISPLFIISNGCNAAVANYFLRVVDLRITRRKDLPLRTKEVNIMQLWSKKDYHFRHWW